MKDLQQHSFDENFAVSEMSMAELIDELLGSATFCAHAWLILQEPTAGDALAHA